MYGFRNRTRNSSSKSAADDQAGSRTRVSPTSGIVDNRSTTTQLVKMQNAIQFANESSRRRKNARENKKEEQAAADGSDRRVAEFGDNWEVLEVRDYLARHQLKQQSIKHITGKTVMTLTDGSIILIDANQYWRHESASQENAYYDASHTINGDNALTHFWTQKGHSRRNE